MSRRYGCHLPSRSTFASESTASHQHSAGNMLQQLGLRLLYWLAGAVFQHPFLISPGTSSGTSPDNPDIPPMECFDVVNEGDIILQVRNRTNLRVCSQVLRLNSTVFSAMLGKDWAEGKALIGATAGAPCCLNLPEDDAEAMKLLCLVLHSRSYTLGEHPSPSAFLQYAEVTDKYNCAKAAKLFSDACFHRFERMGPARMSLQEYAMILQAAVRLDNATAFTIFADIVIFHWKTSDLLNTRCDG